VPRRFERAGVAAAAMVGAGFLLTGFAIAPVLAAPDHQAASSPCGSGGKAAAVSAKLLAYIDTSPSASPSITGSPSDAASPSPTDPGTGVTDSPRPSGTKIAPSPSSTSPSPSPSPTGSKSHSPTPSPSPSRHVAAMCVSAQIVQRSSKSQPGGTMTYSVWVWSTVKASQVTATVTSNSSQMLTPQYTVCPVAHGTTCSVGSLPTNQAFELVITDKVRTGAKAGKPITLNVSVSATNLSPAEAAVSTLVGAAIPSPAPTSGGAGVTLPPSAFPSFPATTVTPGSLSGLFPVVTPSPSPRSSHGSHGVSSSLAGVTSSALPLDPRLIGGQLAGLAVLAAAITMVIARLQLRTPQTAQAGQSGAAAPTAGSSVARPLSLRHHQPRPDSAPQERRPASLSYLDECSTSGRMLRISFASSVAFREAETTTPKVSASAQAHSAGPPWTPGAQAA
jgi:hypothetical protein